MRDIHAISYELCGTEFMALLLECCEIKKLWPIHNRALKKYEPKFALYHYEARSGYQYLAIGKLTKDQECVELFHSQYDAVNLLLKLAGAFNIDHRFCHYSTSEHAEPTSKRKMIIFLRRNIMTGYHGHWITLSREGQPLAL